MLKIKIEARAKCKRHPAYDPAKEGRTGIVGGCAACGALLDMFDASLLFQRLAGARLFDPMMPISDMAPPSARTCGEYVAPSGSSIAGSAHFRYKDR